MTGEREGGVGESDLKKECQRTRLCARVRAEQSAEPCMSRSRGFVSCLLAAFRALSLDVLRSCE